MPFWNRFPYTQLNNINLDWIIKKVKALADDVAAIDVDEIEAAAAAATEAAEDATEAAQAASSAISTLPSDSLPIMDGTAAAGTATKLSRADHVHPTDTSRASAASVAALPSDSTPVMDGTAAAGTATKLSRADHVHPHDTAGDAIYLSDVAIAASSTEGTLASVSDSRITANHVVAFCFFDKPEYLTTDITWTTSAGNLLLTGISSAATSAKIVLVYSN